MIKPPSFHFLVIKSDRWLWQLFFLGLIALPIPATYAEDAVVTSNKCDPTPLRVINLKGLHRIEPATAKRYVKLHQGELCQSQNADLTVLSLYQSDFFSQAKVSCCADTATIEVIERPVIAHIQLTGNQNIKSDDLKKTLKDLGLFEGWNFKPSALKTAEAVILQQYRLRGYYRANVKTIVKMTDAHQATIHFEIKEGDVARIKQIIIQGNLSFSKSTLLKQFQLSETGFISRILGSDKYNQATLAGDLERLSNFYQDHGYAAFHITASSVAMNPELDQTYIVILVDEGPKYQFGTIHLIGKHHLSPQQIASVLQFEPNETYSRAKLADMIEKLENMMGNKSYAFANISPKLHFDNQLHRINIDLLVDSGSQYTVRKIHIAGNKASENRVIRRELEQMEAAPYSTEKIQASQKNLQRKTYFKNPNISTKKLQPDSKQVDLDVHVEEVPSGHYGVSLGYAQVEGFLLNLHITEDNFLGSGRQVGFEFDRSKYEQVYSIQYNNPYITPDNVGLGGSLFYSKTNLAEANISDYSIDKIGANLNLGIPVGPHSRIIPGVGITNLKLKTNSDPQYVSTQVQDFINGYGHRFVELTPGLGYIYDNRDRAVLPRHGNLFQISSSVATPGSDLEYYKAEMIEEFYQALSKSWTFKWKGDVGYGNGLHSARGLPLFANFYAGGINSVRGFEDNTLGPRDSLDNNFGGNLMVVSNAELAFPLPGADIEGLQGVFFLDGGNIYADNDHVSKLTASGPIRWSTGTGIEWYSSFGTTIELSFGFPLNAQKNDERQIFQFSLGGGF